MRRSQRKLWQFLFARCTSSTFYLSVCLSIYQCVWVFMYNMYLIREYFFFFFFFFTYHLWRVYSSFCSSLPLLVSAWLDDGGWVAFGIQSESHLKHYFFYWVWVSDSGWPYPHAQTYFMFLIRLDLSLVWPWFKSVDLVSSDTFSLCKCRYSIFFLK